MFPIICLWMEIIKSYKTILQKFNITYTQYIAMLVLGQHDKIKFKNLGKSYIQILKFIKKYRTQEYDRAVIVELTEKGINMKDEILEVPKKYSVILVCVNQKLQN